MEKKSLGWFTIGSLASSSLSFISIPIIAWRFSEDDIGKVALLVSASGLCTIILSLGMDQSFTREYYESENKSELILNSMLPGVTLFLLLAAVIVAFQPTVISWVLFNERSVWMSLFTLWYLFIVLVSRFLTLHHRMCEDGKRYAVSLLLQKSIFVGFICFSYLRASTHLTHLMAAHGLSVLTGLVYLLSTTRKVWAGIRFPVINIPLIRRLLSFGLPMATSGILFWGLEGVDKFMLRSSSSFSELGIYSVALSISAMANVATSLFTTVWIPIVYRWIAQKDCLSRIDEVTGHLLAIVVILICATGTMSWVLELMLPQQQGAVQHMILGCMLWPLFYALSETTGLGIAVQRSTKLGLLAAAAALTVNVALNLVLLPELGSRGAAVSLATSIWTFFVLRTEISHRIWRPTPRLRLYAWTFCILALSCVQAVWGSSARLPLIACWFSLLFVSFWAFRGSISGALKYTRRLTASIFIRPSN